MTIEIKLQNYIDKFMEFCSKSKDWKTYEREDLVQVKNSFHKFIWIHHLHPETFKSEVKDPHCIIQSDLRFEPFDYIDIGISKERQRKIVKVSFMAWVLPATFPVSILRLFDDMPNLQNWVALYDLSRVFSGESLSLKLNKTKSPVFNEFERFLSDRYNIKFEPISSFGSF